MAMSDFFSTFVVEISESKRSTNLKFKRHDFYQKRPGR